MNISFKKITILTAAAAGLLAASQSQGQLVLSGTGTGGDGAISAEVIFNLVGPDQLSITLINTLSQGTSQWAAGQLLSGISFNVNGGTGTDLTSGNGDIASTFTVAHGNNSYTDTGSQSIILPTGTWQVGHTGSGAGFNVNMNVFSGGSPADMIIGDDSLGGTSGAGIYNVNNSVSGHQPIVLGQATFVLTISNLTSLAQIETNTVEISFGTSDNENHLTPGPVPVPESATILSAALMLVPLSVQLIRKGWKRSQPKTD